MPLLEESRVEISYVAPLLAPSTRVNIALPCTGRRISRRRSRSGNDNTTAGRVANGLRTLEGGVEGISGVAGVGPPKPGRDGESNRSFIGLAGNLATWPAAAMGVEFGSGIRSIFSPRCVSVIDV